jgi:hypothetical protein
MKNYEWTNFAWFPLLSHEMLNLWWNELWLEMLIAFEQV